MNYVKNTMLVQIADLLAPHYCCSCGKVGSALCQYCEYDITSEPFGSCVACSRPTYPSSLCRDCQVDYGDAWCVGERSGALKSLIDQYKFSRQSGARQSLVRIFDQTLPVFGTDVTVVPVPTVRSHIRQRGYAHIESVARDFAAARGLGYSEPLARASQRSQHKLSRAERIANAKQAFGVKSVVSGKVLLVDDIYTTGATINAATTKLLAAGASEVLVALLARQPLEK